MNAVDFDKTDLDALRRLNRLRSEPASETSQALERHFAERYQADRRFAVYGTLAPGKPNHHHLSDLDGIWTPGHYVTGRLEQSGWGADMGYPALRWSESGEAIEVQLFACDELPRHWARLDAFEGDEYLRILVPVHAPDGSVTVANVYAARPDRHA